MSLSGSDCCGRERSVSDCLSEFSGVLEADSDWRIRLPRIILFARLLRSDSFDTLISEFGERVTERLPRGDEPLGLWVILRSELKRDRLRLEWPEFDERVERLPRLIKSLSLSELCELSLLAMVDSGVESRRSELLLTKRWGVWELFEESSPSILSSLEFWELSPKKLLREESDCETILSSSSSNNSESEPESKQKSK